MSFSAPLVRSAAVAVEAVLAAAALQMTAARVGGATSDCLARVAVRSTTVGGTAVLEKLLRSFSRARLMRFLAASSERFSSLATSERGRSSRQRRTMAVRSRALSEAR